MRYTLFALVVAATLCLTVGAPLTERSETDVDVDPMYKGMPMSIWRMCTAWHCEGCAPTADPPGPCTRREDCEKRVCDPRVEGSCAMNPKASFCEDVVCPKMLRFARYLPVRLGRRDGGIVSEEDVVEDDQVQEGRDV